MTPLEIIIYFILFGVLGASGETLWSCYNNFLRNKSPRVVGHISAWMFPIYGSILFIILFVQSFASGWHIIIRGFLYAIIVTTWEFSSGWIIKKIFGIAPWDYSGKEISEGIGSKKKYNLKGLICLNYIPLWGVAGLLAEQLFFYLQTHLIL